MTLQRATPVHVVAMALIHAASFPPAERWGPDAMALQLSLPGTYGFICLLPLPPGEGRGEGSGKHRPTLQANSAARTRQRSSRLPHPDPLPEGEGGGGLILARVAADEAEILTLAVAPPAQNHGLGRCLLQAALDHAQTHGASSMFLEVSPANAPALALYARAGFAPVGRRPRYYPGGGDALVLRRALSPGAAAAGASRPPGA